MTIERNSTEWFEALDAFIAEHRTTPFEWGAHDCFTFAAAWVQAVRGKDLMDGLRNYDSAKSAYRLIGTFGGLTQAVESRMGEHIPGPFAQAGDVARVTTEQGTQALAVCIGSALALPGEEALVLLPIDRAEATWRV